MSLLAIITVEYIPLLERAQSTSNNALVQGESLYMKALSSGLPVLEARMELLSIDDLPRVVNVLYSAPMFCREMRDTVINEGI